MPALFLSLAFLFSTLSSASMQNEILAPAGVTIQDIEPTSDNDYKWLYEILFPADIRSQYPERSFKSFRVHLKDSYKNFMDPRQITKDHLKSLGYQTGKITYVGFFPKAYKYDVVPGNAGELIFQVRVFLKNAKGDDTAFFQSRIQEAQNIWNAARVPMDFNYRFEFSIVAKKDLAHFAVNVKDSTRGPYDTNWGRDWNGRTIAHELGHMLGLGDEYKTISGESDCYEESLMCDSWNGELMPHHFYFILRRLIVPED